MFLYHLCIIQWRKILCSSFSSRSCWNQGRNSATISFTSFLGYLFPGHSSLFYCVPAWLRSITIIELIWDTNANCTWLNDLNMKKESQLNSFKDKQSQVIDHISLQTKHVKQSAMVTLSSFISSILTWSNAQVHGNSVVSSQSSIIRSGTTCNGMT